MTMTMTHDHDHDHNHDTPCCDHDTQKGESFLVKGGYDGWHLYGSYSLLIEECEHSACVSLVLKKN
jgi:hypothetical protein